MTSRFPSKRLAALEGRPAVTAEARYLAAWDRAMRACAAVGGTITHHHGIGRMKSRCVATELGAIGVDMLTRIRAALDPDGIMKPGSAAAVSSALLRQ